MFLIVISNTFYCIGMQLVDDGYDVWLANSRGNTYSRKHVSLNYKQKAYWNFRSVSICYIVKILLL